MLSWLRNAKPIRLEDIRAMPNELGARLTAADLPGLPRLIGQQLAGSPPFWLTVIGAGALLWRRRAIISATESLTPRIGKPTTDRMSYTWRVLGLTLLLAAPLPLLSAVTGWQLQGRRRRNRYPMIFRTYPIWYPLIVGAPLALIALAWTGYVYTATAFSDLFLLTLWFLAALMLSNALALRWLQVTRRRLAYDAAMERRRAERAEAAEHEALGEMGELQFEEEEVDITALSDETRGLIRILILTAAIVGLYLIWSSALPALHIFDDVILWHGTVTVDGTEQSLPITLGSLGLALLYAVGTWVLADRLPALLEIVLLQRFHMTAAGRYTLTTLTTYVVVAVGLLLVLSTLGARWSQVQWLAAALSVGDAVTVGDTDGVVTKIKIRATTIRNWDGKELLVPNKEFITGRLLNWSLSDQTTRLVLAIGIAFPQRDLHLDTIKPLRVQIEHT
ncbi:mechanosensitive ion channel domain-containing protein [Thiocapsa sp.]|uniref:mechanosensitive ion channel domain-containing protein n=1 Tax=Thiocapsa sp. TaxID=2024551 RepID=UPI0025CE4599|nr:mechanosensitive ion channel domain-containing protein [Thiocapsa sp.]